jgi:hypothetical protein
VTLRLTRWRGRAGRALLLVLALALIPLPVAAGEATSATKAKTSQVSLKAGVARAAARTPLAPAGRARRAEQDTSAKASPGFFKTRQGAVALAVMVVGAGYAIYSAKNDRITSPAKK